MKLENGWREAMIAFVAVLAVGIFGIAYAYHKGQQKVSEPLSSTSSTVSSSQNSQSDTSITSTNSQLSTNAQTGQSNCWTAQQAWSEIDKSGCVTFTVGYTYTSAACNAYLDQSSAYSSGFSVWIPDGCGLGSTLLNEYADKTIDVSGTITSYKGAPEIEVTSASQLSLAQ